MFVYFIHLFDSSTIPAFSMCGLSLSSPNFFFSLSLTFAPKIDKISNVLMWNDLTHCCVIHTSFGDTRLGWWLIWTFILGILGYLHTSLYFYFCVSYTMMFSKCVDKLEVRKKGSCNLDEPVSLFKLIKAVPHPQLTHLCGSLLFLCNLFPLATEGKCVQRASLVQACRECQC